MEQKWGCPTYMYDGAFYPKMLSGPGYVMSRKTAECLYASATLRVPFFHLEDVFMTGFAADQCRVRPTNTPGFHNLKPSKFHPRKDFLIHYITPKQRSAIFRKMKEIIPP